MRKYAGFALIYLKYARKLHIFKLCNIYAYLTIMHKYCIIVASEVLIHEIYCNYWRYKEF